MNKQYTKIYLTYSPELLKEIIRKKLFKQDISFKRFNKIYIDTFNKERLIDNNLRKIKNSIYISYRIIDLAYRFKRFKINKTDKNFYTLPFADDIDLTLRYIISITDIIVNKYNLQENIEIYVNRFQDNYINIFLSRYFKKKYNIKINYVLLGKLIRPNSVINFSVKPYNLISIFSIFKLIPIKKRIIKDNFKNKKLLEITSLKKVANGPYKIPENDYRLSNILCSIDFNDISKYGLNKINSILFLLYRNIKKLRKIKIKDIYKVIKYNLLIDHIQINMNFIYIYNICLLFKKTKIKYLFCSHRSFFYEKLIYKACKISNVKSISYDFSFGYPLKYIYKKEVCFTTKPDIFIVKNNFRMDQYENANKDYLSLGKKLEIIKCNCMQIEYARGNNNFKNISGLDNEMLISIFDNNYGENASIRFQNAVDLVKVLSKYKDKVSCIVHSKVRRFYLEKELCKNKIKSHRALKGDFTLSKKSKFIISIGFQGSAIDAAFAFNKPIIFFSSNKSYFNDFFFSNDLSYNEKVVNTFKNLIYSSTELETLISNNNSFYETIEKLESTSSNFLKFIGISDKSQYVISYLADLCK